ncbi:MAG: sigma-70 family RNA polymerase sigma factor [Bacteroidota bacterium]
MGAQSICEEAVFHQIHKDLAVSLRNFLYYKFGDIEKSRDFVQEAFVRLWKNCSKVGSDKAKSYLYTIANRLFLDDVGHQKVQLKFQKRMQTTESQMETNPEFVYRQKEFKKRLEQAISSLSEQQRSVFLMSRIDKMKNREIAVALDLSIKTVEKHVSNALKLLKGELEDLKNIKI